MRETKKTRTKKTTAAHTPGPWYSGVGANKCFHQGNRVTICSQTDGIEATIAEVWPTDSDADIADGRLIAAAPDMLAALEGFAAWEAADSPMNDDLRALFEQARTIIARAKGTP